LVTRAVRQKLKNEVIAEMTGTVLKTV